jgi:iron complex outermembrane receptor protein
MSRPEVPQADRKRAEMRARMRAARRSLIASGLLFGVATSTLAQQDPLPVVKLEKVEVTGSNIPRVEGESGLPLQILTREELADGGVQTAQELLERISANQSFGGWNEAKGVGHTIVGFTGASLRGLGSQRTLVLMNGRRLAPYALSGGQSVDLSGIPISALERVEVLKDGASAVYGTDAIGGVINFILRKDYQGAEVNANYFSTEQGGGNSGRANATAGFGDLAKDKYNVFISADYFKQDALKASQRDSTKTAYLPQLGLDQTSPDSFPANIAQTNLVTGQIYGFFGLLNPTIPFPGGATPTSCAEPYSFSTHPPQTPGRPSFRPYQCRFDFASVIDSIPEAEKANVIGRFTRQLDSNNQFFAEGSYYHGKFIQHIAPTPVDSGETNTPMMLPPTSAYYPAAFVAGLPGGNPALPLEVLYRTVELGPRVNQVHVDQWNAVVGMEGTFKTWDYQLAASYTANRQADEYVSGFISERAFGPLLRAGVINPFGPNTDAVLALMRATQVTGRANDNRASNYGADFKIENTVYELPGGPVALALGLDGRRESLTQKNADFVVSGDIIGGAGAVPSLPAVRRTVGSLFGEANVPVVKSLEANLAVRYDHYSDFGSTTNPKITLRWQPSKQVLLRGAYGTGFRVPTLSDLFQPQSVSLAGQPFADPVRCPITGAPIDCGNPDFGFIQVKTGGNPSLQPERSRQINVGIVVEPISRLSASVDYYRTKLRDVIEIVPTDTIFGDFSRWAGAYVVRKPPDAQHPNLPGEIDYIVQYPTNVGGINTSGLDVSLQWRGPATPIGRFSLGLDGTYVLSYAHTGFESSLFPPSVGTRGPDGAIARYRQYAQLNWTDDQWGATLANTFQDGYREVDLLSCDPTGLNCTGTRRVGSYSVWDLQGRYSGISNLTLSMGVRNLLNTPPPVSNQSAFQPGIDPSYADPRGRTYYVAVRYAFK